MKKKQTKSKLKYIRQKNKIGNIRNREKRREAIKEGNIRKGYETYIGEVGKVNKKPKKTYSYETFKNTILSDLAAGSDLTVAINDTVESAFGFSFNKYGGKTSGKSDIQVRSWKQAQHILDRMKQYELPTDDSTLAKIRYGEINADKIKEMLTVAWGEERGLEMLTSFWGSD